MTVFIARCTRKGIARSRAIAGCAKTCSKEDRMPVITTPVSTPRGRPPTPRSGRPSDTAIMCAIGGADDRTDRGEPQYVSDGLREAAWRMHAAGRSACCGHVHSTMTGCDRFAVPGLPPTSIRRGRCHAEFCADRPARSGVTRY